MANNENAKIPNQLVSPTALGIAINAALNCKQSIDILPNSTLNELYDILKDESVGRKNGRDFELSYFGIGIGGSRTQGVNSSFLERRVPFQHKAVDFNAFYPIPFLIRELGDDIDEEERKKYRLRVVKKVGEKWYIMYYLKLIDFSEFDPTMKIGSRNPSDGNDTNRPYTPRREDLEPTPYELTSSNSVPITDTFVNGTGKMNFSLNSNDLEEVRNVCRILFNDVGLAALNEFYAAYGIETTHDGQVTEGATVPYKEVISASVAFHITEAHARDTSSNNNMPYYFWYGNSIPLLVTDTSIASS